MAVKRDENGNFLVENALDASALFNLLTTLNAEIQAVYEENDLDAMMSDRRMASQVLANYLASQKQTEIRNPHGKAIVIERKPERWIWDESDIPADYSGPVTPLSRLIPKTLWNKVTKRVVDPQKIDEAVRGGELKLETAAKARIEILQTRYLKMQDE